MSPFHAWAMDTMMGRMRAVEVARFGSTSVARVDQSYRSLGASVLSFKLIKNLGRVKEDVHPVKFTVMMEHEPAGVFIYDLFWDGRGPLAPTEDDLGRLRWFLESVEATRTRHGHPPETYFSDRELGMYQRLVSAPQMQGDLLAPEEAEAYRLLSLPPPHLWPDDQFFEWAGSLDLVPGKGCPT